MEIKFLGATECITGSCHLLMVCGKKILLDCGLFQGRDEKVYSNDEFDFNPREIDCVILSHCHVDHSGRIPLLYKRGFEGKVFCTKPTVELTSYLLLDTVKIFSEDVYFKNLDRQKKNMEPLKELFDESDVKKAIENFCGYDYEEEIPILEDIKLVFHDAGHVLGSAICEILVKVEDNKWSKLVYSGDIGNVNKEILNDPEKGIDCDYLIMEGTYGNKVHPNISGNYQKLKNIINSTMIRGGNVIIPCFSLGRSQEIIYMLNRYVEGGFIKNCSVYVDSPLAASITEVFKKYQGYYDNEAKRLLASGDDPLDFKGLYFVDEDMRKTLYGTNGGAVIIASGVNSDGGRVGRHLKNNINRRECSIVITSYKGKKSIGSKLLKGYKIVEILGQKMVVKSSIYYLGGLSGHADREGLLKWVGSFKRPPKKIFLVHGSRDSLVAFKNSLKNKGYYVRIVRKLDKIMI